MTEVVLLIGLQACGMSRRRNADRPDPVPEVGLHAALACWEDPDPGEGFDVLVLH